MNQTEKTNAENKEAKSPVIEGGRGQYEVDADDEVAVEDTDEVVEYGLTRMALLDGADASVVSRLLSPLVELLSSMLASLPLEEPKSAIKTTPAVAIPKWQIRTWGITLVYVLSVCRSEIVTNWCRSFVSFSIGFPELKGRCKGGTDTIADGNASEYITILTLKECYQ